jgi:hypothetical protein
MHRIKFRGIFSMPPSSKHPLIAVGEMQHLSTSLDGSMHRYEADSAAADSGVNENVTSQFPGSTVQVGGTKRGENPTIPVEEGGEEANKLTGR